MDKQEGLSALIVLDTSLHLRLLAIGSLQIRCAQHLDISIQIRFNRDLVFRMTVLYRRLKIRPFRCALLFFQLK